MLSDPWFYAVAIPAVFIVGLGKGGFGGGASMIGVPLLALAVPPLEAAAILLPIMIVMDVVAIYAWWGVFDRRSLAILVPAMTLGVGIGWAVAAYVTDDVVQFTIGAVAIAFTANYVLSGGSRTAKKQPNVFKGGFWGVIGGFTSFISHAGGPPVQMYLLPLKLDSKLFVGTTVLAFAVTNFVKLLPYAMLGQFSPSHLATSAALLPVAPISTFIGARLIRVIPSELFYRFTYAALFLIGVKLLYDGAASLW